MVYSNAGLEVPEYRFDAGLLNVGRFKRKRIAKLLPTMTIAS